MYLKSQGYKAKSYQGWQVPIITDSTATKARIESRSNNVRADLKEGTNGRIRALTPTQQPLGASDTSAAAIAAAPKADVCRDIHRCRQGLYHRPDICKEARKIEKISYDEMLELASLGAKVLQPAPSNLQKEIATWMCASN